MISVDRINVASLERNENVTAAFNTETSNIYDEALILMPRFQSIRNRITRKRNDFNLKKGATYEELPECFKVTLDGKEFGSLPRG